MKKKMMLHWFEQGSIAIPKLLMMHYKKLGLNETEFMVVLHVHTFLESGNSFPTPSEISERMTITEMKCMEVIQALIQKGFLSLEGGQRSEAMMCESYSLQPLWEKILHFLMDESIEEEQKEKKQLQVNLYTVFEKEFGRPLSPFECETLGMWEDQDQHHPNLIQAALREAVMSGKLNFRYIDRILFEWKKNGIKTVDQAQNQGQKFRANQQRAQQMTKQETKFTGKVPFYNWLEQ
ncbi:DNA replication protein DnaD [Bacillus cereus]|jgi:DNA replication protein|uniref:DNA replication protein DnaD n=2 Tax=Bacillus thuringiensis TaxID=1428 RepID=A0A9X7AHN7_BACTU|nr:MULTISPECIES: DNA replication protein DnaD [Bacillus]EJS61594.1 DnaD and phage-associated domain-containing protein [Bacillus cereus BAG1X1-2]EPF10842.1 DnaD and phage-associated domain-containing protein [Bacillus cereus BAG1O-3]KAB2367110.1 DNA replication protein DnaD [Bacillus thuringiensis]KIQ90000.1 DNA replication protein DnaD [Bacillus sp. L_1B0_5]KIQ90764.1 DNA replication protein DnaD [Bacillus sp. L_1B0_8]